MKPGFEQPIAITVHDKTVEFFTTLLQVLHPFMPFITEEMYHLLAEREDDLCIKQYDAIHPADKEILHKGSTLKQFITSLRSISTNNRPPQLLLPLAHSLIIKYPEFYYILKNKEKIKIFNNKEEYENANKTTSTTTTSTTTMFPFNEHKIEYIIEGKDLKEEKNKLTNEKIYLEGFILSVDKKLNNERFIQNAKPELVEREKKKKEDAETKLKVIEESLAALQ